MFTKTIGAVALAGAVMAAAPAQAADFILTSATDSSTWTGSVGNTMSRTANGITLTASAATVSSLTSVSPTSAYLGQYKNGLGVSIDGNDAHSIDNVGSFDFVILSFSQAVRLTDIVRKGYDVDNSPSSVSTDAWVSYLKAGDSSWGDVFSRGSTVASATNAINAVTSNNFSTIWFVGAARTTTSRDDGFKLSAVTAVTTPAVPEPATWVMMIAGFGAVGSALRRRRAEVRVTYA